MDENLRRALEAYDSRGYELVLLTPESQALVRNSEESVLLDRNGNVTAIPILRADNRGDGKDKVAGRRGITEVTGLTFAMLLGLVLGLAIAPLAGKSGRAFCVDGPRAEPIRASRRRAITCRTSANGQEDQALRLRRRHDC